MCYSRLMNAITWILWMWYRFKLLIFRYSRHPCLCLREMDGIHFMEKKMSKFVMRQIVLHLQLAHTALTVPSLVRVSIVVRVGLFHPSMSFLRRLKLQVWPYILLHFVVINQRQKRRPIASCAIHEIVFGSVRHGLNIHIKYMCIYLNGWKWNAPRFNGMNSNRTHTSFQIKIINNKFI